MFTAVFSICRSKPESEWTESGFFGAHLVHSTGKLPPANVAVDKWFKCPGAQKVGPHTLEFNVVLQDAGTEWFRLGYVRVR